MVTTEPEAMDGFVTESDSDIPNTNDLAHEVDQIAEKLNKKAENIIKNRKRRRVSNPSPRIHSTSAKNVKLPSVAGEQPTVNNMWSMVMEKFTTMTDEIRAMREDLNESLTNSAIVANEVQNLKNLILKKDEAIEELQKSISTRDKTITSLEARVDQLERDAISDSMILTSSNFIGKDLEENRRHVSAITGLPVKDLEDRSEWTKFGQNGDQVIVKVQRSDIKATIFHEVRNRRQFQCYVSELLTPKNDALFYEARKFKKTHKNIHSVFTYKGQIYVRQTQNANPILIKQIQNLDRFLPSTATRPPLPRFDPTTPPPPIPTPRLTIRGASTNAEMMNRTF